MQGRMKRAIQGGSLLISILFHLLVLFLLTAKLSFFPTKKIEIEKPPQLYLPSYVYQEPVQTPVQPTPIASDIPESKKGMEMPIPAANKAEKTKPKEVDKKKVEAPPKTKTPPQTETKPKPQTNTVDHAKSEVMEAVNLVGEKKEVQPLIEILGKALGARLQYPRIAIDFNLTGTSYIGFTLHPSGLVTGAKVVKSSGAGVLDDAALSGVKAMSPVLRVGPYVEKPRYMVVGIIFEGERRRR